jgi:hypothetical protein
MRSPSPDTLLFCLEYRVIDPDQKTLAQVRYSALWDNEAKKYIKPKLEFASSSRLLVFYHIGDKVKADQDRLSWFDADVLSPCETQLRQEGYTVSITPF